MSSANSLAAPSSKVDRSPVMIPAAAPAVLIGNGGEPQVVTGAVDSVAPEATGAAVTDSVFSAPQAIVVVHKATSAITPLTQQMAGMDKSTPHD